MKDYVTKNLKTSRSMSTADVLLSTAVKSFANEGYEATTMRQLARKVGIQTASFYNYYESKLGLLWAIISDAMEDLESRQIEAGRSVESAPEQLHRFVRVHVEYHATHADQAQVVNTQFVSLPPDQYADVIAFRKRYEAMLCRILAEGNGQSFQVSDVTMAAYAILGMGTAVSQWFRADGRLSVEELCELQVEFALRIAGSYRDV